MDLVFGQQTSGLLRFLYAFLRQVHIGPAREEIVGIPDAFSMTQKDESGHFSSAAAMRTKLGEKMRQP